MVKPDLCHRRSVVFPSFAGVARQTSATGGTPITTTATPDCAGDGTPDLCHAVAVECGTSQENPGGVAPAPHPSRIRELGSRAPAVKAVRSHSGGTRPLGGAHQQR